MWRILGSAGTEFRAGRLDRASFRGSLPSLANGMPACGSGRRRSRSRAAWSQIPPRHVFHARSTLRAHGTKPPPNPPTKHHTREKNHGNPLSGLFFMDPCEQGPLCLRSHNAEMVGAAQVLGVMHSPLPLDLLAVYWISLMATAVLYYYFSSSWSSSIVNRTTLTDNRCERNREIYFFGS